MFKTNQENIIGRYIYEIAEGQWNIPDLRKLLEHILSQNTSFNDFEIKHNFKSIGQRTLLLNARRIYNEPHKTQKILLAIEDITERRQIEDKQYNTHRLYATLSQINQVIAREQDRQKLFQRICDIMIRFGKFRMAWIGLVEADKKIVTPSAFSGADSDHLQSIQSAVVNSLILRRKSGQHR